MLLRDRTARPGDLQVVVHRIAARPRAKLVTVPRLDGKKRSSPSCDAPADLSTAGSLIRGTSRVQHRCVRESGRIVAAVSTSDTPGASVEATLRVRLEGAEALHERAAWALEALLARARVVDWRLVGQGEPADLTWSTTSATLPHEPACWSFRAAGPPPAARDPLAFAFWWLAREEERLADEDSFDEHGRFRYDASALSRLEDPLAAPVDELATTLAEALRPWCAPLVEGDPAWRLVLTHDIDLPWRWTWTGRRRAARALRDALRRGRAASAARTAAALVAMPAMRMVGRDPWSNARRIAALEERLGASSTSYLLVGAHTPEDGDDELHARGASYLRALVALDESGDRIGLHGSYTSSVVTGRLALERERIERDTGRTVTDHRFHYLRHRPVEAWPMLDRAGIRTDASLGYAEQPGFRAGTAHPYRAWDHEAGTPLDLVVIPLAVMDATFDERYLDVRDHAAREQHVQEAIGRIAAYRGSASLLIHNDRLCNRADDGWTRSYRSLLRHVATTGGVACTAAHAGAKYRARIPAWRTGSSGHDA